MVLVWVLSPWPWRLAGTLWTLLVTVCIVIIRCTENFLSPYIYIYNHNIFGAWIMKRRPHILVLHVLCKDLADTVVIGRCACNSRKFYFHSRHVRGYLASPCISARLHNTFPTQRSLPHFSYGLPTPSVTTFVISYRPSTCFFLPSSETFYYFPVFITTELHQCLFLLSEPLSYIQGEHKVVPWLQTFITRKLLYMEYKLFFF
jgi:hypothetical protein